MSKKIILSLAATALSAIAIGCGGNGGGGNGGSGGTGGGGGSADMGGAFACVMSPTSDPDILNGCAPAGVDTFLIQPTYPTLAPNGVLPQLQ